MDPNQQPSTNYNQNPYAASTAGVVPDPGGNDDHHRRNVIIITVLSVLSVLLLGAGIWLFSLYNQQKNNVDQIAAERVDAALEQQQQELNQQFTKERESDTTKFKGPSIYGSLNFDYPKLWSVYNNPDVSSSVLYEVKVHPNAVGRGVSGEAVVVQVIDSTYDEQLSDFDSQIEDGTVKAKAIESNGQKGVRLSGAVGDDESQSGVKVLLPIRDRTISFSGLSEKHRDVFNASLKSLKFQP